MGNTCAKIAISSYSLPIKTKDNKTHYFSYYDLVEHILLLRQVINHPEMTEDGPELKYYIQDYRERMGNEQMSTKKQQLNIPWQTEWIWHVHRLHPFSYINDCKQQLSCGVVNKTVQIFVIKQKQKESRSGMKPLPIKTDKLFVTSIDLTKAVIQQREFLDKFKKHHLMSDNLNDLNRIHFENLVQNYVSFVKLARKDQLIVPTFDIDIIWHTHMRYPSQYEAFSVDLCGFVLDHDDSIGPNILTDGYTKTADYWRQTYGSEYGNNIDREKLAKSQYLSSCAMIVVPVQVSNDSYNSWGGSGYTFSQRCGARASSRGSNRGRTSACGGRSCGGHCSDGGMSCD